MDKLTSCFAKTFGIEEEKVTEDLAYESIPQWDSIGHMTLVASIESAFDVTMGTDDIIDMSSVKKAREILKTYRVGSDAS